MYYYDDLAESQDDALYSHKMTYLFCLTFRKNIAGITTGLYGCGLKNVTCSLFSLIARHFDIVKNKHVRFLRGLVFEDLLIGVLALSFVRYQN